jgi:transforming growth factor-beta-induced protein
MKALTRLKIATIGLACVTTFGGLLATGTAQASSDPATQSEQSQRTAAGKNVVAKLAKTGNFSTLITAVQSAGLTDTLANTQNITVFAPTDAAFAKIPSAQLQAILADKAKLTDLLTYHVSSQRLSERALARRGKTSTLFGAEITVTGSPEDLVLNGNVGLTLGDIAATNGVIHQIDTVLSVPEKPKDIVDTAVAAGSFKTLVGAVQAAGLESTLRTTQNLSLFAPTDAAFAKIPPATLQAIVSDKNLLTSILTYHVLPRTISAELFLANAPGRVRTLQGERIKFAVVDGRLILNGNVAVTVTDIKASNGIIHVIDTVLVPPSTTTPSTTTPSTTVLPTTIKPTTVPPTTAAPSTVKPSTVVPTTGVPTTSAPTTVAAQKDILETARAAGSFNTLLAALDAAHLTDTIRNAKNITVFAPTDAAFAKLGDAKIKQLLADPKTLGKILTYHVAGQQLTAAQLSALTSVDTLAGEKIAVNIAFGPIALNITTTVIAADIKAKNGIIHVIDTVLIPPSLGPNQPPTTVVTTVPPTTVRPTTVPATTMPATTVPATKDIVDTAIANGSFKTLIVAVQTAGIEQTLRTTKNITVFAPTDAAFAKLGDAKIAALLKDIPTLTKILTYHVAPGVSTEKNLSQAIITTLNGERLKFTVVNGKLVINGNINVVITDIKASNGIIHVIDAVLIPPSLA